jgi:hypothetical protein
MMTDDNIPPLLSAKHFVEHRREPLDDPVVDGTGGRGLISLAKSSRLSGQAGAVDNEVPSGAARDIGSSCNEHLTRIPPALAEGHLPCGQTSHARQCSTRDDATDRDAAHFPPPFSAEYAHVLGHYDDGRARKAEACRSCAATRTANAFPL